MTEEWKAVPGYEGLYEVSSTGAIRSLDRCSATGNRLSGSTLRPTTNSRYGHLRVRFSKGGIPKSLYVHQVVLLAFVGPPPQGKPQVRHLDGNPRNNALSNLTYGSARENAADCIRHGTKAIGGRKVSASKKGIRTVYGSNHGMAKLTPQTAKEIYDLMHSGASGPEVARQYGVSHHVVYQIKNRKLWTHIHEDDGTIVDTPAVVDPETGEVLEPPTFKPGYYVNAIGELPEAVGPYMVPYGSGGRIFAGIPAD